MRVTVITPPAPVVTWAEADQHLRLAGDEGERVYVESLIAAATAHIDGPEGWLGRAVGVQTLELRRGGLGSFPICLPYRPIIDIVSVHYLDATGTAALVDPATYELFGHELGNSWGKSWPSPGASPGQTETVRIQYRAGYAEVPSPIKAAILLMVGDMFRSRASFATMSVSEVPMATTVAALLSPYRVYA